MTVLYVPCFSTHVELIRLIEVRGGVFGDEDDPILWEIEPESQPPSIESLFITVGETPEGFKENVPFASDVIRSLGWYVIGVESRSYRTFDLKELREGQYLNYRDRYLTEEQFRADEHCV